MAFVFDNRFDAATERNVQDCFATLSEKDQRRFAALQAKQLGYGGVKYVAEVLNCSRRTIERGLAELDINIGLSHDTSQFACDSLLWHWNRIGKQCYPSATSILLLCDCGGSNSANRYIFKYHLQNLADTIGIEIRVAHYSSYCSKYNPIERRLFPHIGRACAGMLFDTVDTVVDLMRKATTSTGLKTTVNVIRRFYETGRNATDEIKRNLKIVFDDLLPKWNYRAIPQHATVFS